MPLTSKGKKILSSMRSQYGEKKGKQVFYASINKGKVTGAEKGRAEGGSVVPTGMTIEERLRQQPEPESISTARDVGRQRYGISPTMTPVERRSAMRRAQGGPVEEQQDYNAPRAKAGRYREEIQHRLEPNNPAYYKENIEEPIRPGTRAPTFNPERGGRTNVYTQRAAGGPAGQGAYIVGEQGPEMFYPDAPGTIIPNHELRRLARKYGGHVSNMRRR
jgi:hypothetical protein